MRRTGQIASTASIGISLVPFWPRWPRRTRTATGTSGSSSYTMLSTTARPLTPATSKPSQRVSQCAVTGLSLSKVRGLSGSRAIASACPESRPVKQRLAGAEFALGAVRAVERERRRLIEFRVIAPVSTPPPPGRIAQLVALLADGEDHALMIPAARVHSFHEEQRGIVARLRRWALRSIFPGRWLCLERAILSSVSAQIEIRRLAGGDLRAQLDGLAAVLADCVEGGASVSYMSPFPHAQARAAFEEFAADVDDGRRVLLAAFADGEVVGTVQIILALPPNQPHRGEIAKLLVRRSARRRGIAQLLMERAEAEAVAEGKTLLVLDTVTGDPAEALYEGMGWTRVGVIPDFALYPDGRAC